MDFELESWVSARTALGSPCTVKVEVNAEGVCEIHVKQGELFKAMVFLEPEAVDQLAETMALVAGLVVRKDPS